MTVVATIGHFDGIHLGHQALLRAMEKRAAETGADTLLILFEPYPRELFLKDAAPPRIQTLTDKLLKLRNISKTPVHLIHFNQAIAKQSPQQFIKQVLKPLGVTELIVGEDFRFGCNRAGGIDELRQAGINPVVVSECLDQGQRISSTQIRECLAAADFTTASRLLGSPYSITGLVIHGAKHGRLLGFPTLNIALRKKIPLSGVYEVHVHGITSSALVGVANLGRRPTLNSLAHPLLEVYLLHFNQDIYGKRVRVEFVRKIRDEQKFESLDALKAQIQKDVSAVESR